MELFAKVGRELRCAGPGIVKTSTSFPPLALVCGRTSWPKGCRMPRGRRFSKHLASMSAEDLGLRLGPLLSRGPVDFHLNITLVAAGDRKGRVLLCARPLLPTRGRRPILSGWGAMNKYEFIGDTKAYGLL